MFLLYRLFILRIIRLPTLELLLVNLLLLLKNNFDHFLDSLFSCCSLFQVFFYFFEIGEGGSRSEIVETGCGSYCHHVLFGYEISEFVILVFYDFVTALKLADCAMVVVLQSFMFGL